MWRPTEKVVFLEDGESKADERTERRWLGPHLGGLACVPKPVILFLPWQTERLSGSLEAGNRGESKKTILRTLEPFKNYKTTQSINSA